MDEVLVIGAGVAGLAAAVEVAERGLPVTILEARERVGGRILTLRPEGAGQAIELGAEFVHGRPPELLSLLEQAHIALDENDGIDACFDGQKLEACPEDDAMSLLDQLDEAVKSHGDMSFDAFLWLRKARQEEAEAARSYVEGFNAADSSKIGIAALARQQHAEEKIDGSRAWRSCAGYDLLPLHLARRAERQGARILLRSPAASVSWTRGEVQATTTDNRTHHGRRMIVTLPLGVLQARAVAFEPEPKEVLGAADRMVAGTVQRVVLVFRHRFWAEKMARMRFLFAEGALPSTWWTQYPSETPVLVGWIGGPLALLPEVIVADRLVAAALRSLEKIFSLVPRSLEDQLRSWHLHDWQSDLYSRGAYSYVPAGAIDASSIISQPVEETLFFAGEHTDVTGHWGTVHGALRSGLRAARQVLEASGKGVSDATKPGEEG